ncbi:MAG: tyrosine-type recombinase/integrase [Deltaproteobacteria bacterium]|nr:tyrosine-type recombinase/integrase [Deltaproteobacteria bacterium]
MPFEKIRIHKTELEPRKTLFKKRFPSESKYMNEFLRLLSIGEINKGKAVGEVRQVKYVYLLSVFFNYLKKKPIAKLTKTGMQTFIEALNKDQIKKQNNEPYSESTKQDIKVALRTYLKWRLPTKYVTLTDWFDTRLKKTTPEYLSEGEIEKLYSACKTNSERFLICVLFDSGMRAEEFLNVRFEDIIEPTDSFPYYKIEAKEEYSKTDGRTIGLYWKYSTETIRNYIVDCKKDPKEPVFKKGYNAIRMFLSRLGRRILNKRVYFHLLRKSSATYYAPKLNRQQLCIRYGWKFSSDMPDIYIKRSGVEEDKVKDIILNNDLSKLTKENDEIKTKFGLMKQQLETYKEENDKIKNTHQKELQGFKENLTKVMTALAALKNQKGNDIYR